MTNPPVAMPPLPEPHFQIVGLGFDVYTDEEMQAYAATLIARVAELEAALQNLIDSEYPAWTPSIDRARAALTKD